MPEIEIIEGIKVKIGRRRSQIIECKNMVITIRTEHERKRDPNTPGKYAEFNYAKRKERRISILKQICYNSFSPNETVFLTLTFDPKKFPDKDLKNVTVTHGEFKLFIKRMNNHYENFKYISTFAQQGNGNWHYHLICNLPPETKESEIYRIWKNGLIKLSAITTDDTFRKKMNYMIKNMNESADKLRGRKGYLCSKNVERDLTITSWRFEDQQEFQDVTNQIMQGSAYKTYEVKRHLGIKGEYLNAETGEILDNFIPYAEITEELKQQGFEDCTAEYVYYNATVKFPERFKPLVTATPRKKK